MSLPLVLLLMLIGYLVGAVSCSVSLNRTISSAPVDCPLGCSCSGNFTVDCSNAGLTAIPNVQRNTRRLVLNGNGIMHLSEAAISGMTNLEELHLHGNRIWDITDGAFMDLLRLKLVDLSSNPLHCGCNLESKLLPLMNKDDGSVGNLQVLNLRDTMCYFPEHLAGTSVRVLNPPRLAGCRTRIRRHPRRGHFCNSNPCQHGGTCHSTMRSSGTCLCREGYEGDFCEWRQGEHLRLKVDDVTGYYIQLQWAIVEEEVMDFRMECSEVQPEPSQRGEQEWLNGTIRSYKIMDVHPDTMYRICLAAFGYDQRRTPGNLIEEVCLHQRTDPVLSTMGDTHPNKPPTPFLPTDSLNSSEGRMNTKMVMTVFGIILTISIILILAVTALYVTRQRGIRILPRRQRRSAPTIVQIESPTYGSTGSPTPSLHEVPAGEPALAIRGNMDIPLILVTSESTEDIADTDDASLEVGTGCPASAQTTSSTDQDQTCTVSRPGEMTARGSADGVSTQGEDFEEADFKKDQSSNLTSEEEVVQC